MFLSPSLRSLRPAVTGHGRPSKRLLNVVAFRDRSLEWDSRRGSSNSNGWEQRSNEKQGQAKRDFLEARQVSLYELFDGSAFLLDVPEYQRPYAWKAKQVQELLSDLQQAFDSGQEHFLGAIVTTRRGESAGEPYWVIDGQQRLTTLVMLLSYLRAWSATQPGLESLAERVHRMLFIPADPLNPAAKARYRLQLRSSDQTFFAENFIASYLPHRYHLSMQIDSPANAASDFHEAAKQLQQQPQPGSSDASRLQQQQQVDSNGSSKGSKSRPLQNETWWRMYCAGDVLACHLATAMEEGLNLQDFVHYVLKHSMVVLMTARDESTSFKIFSTLNGRGVDLAVIDKLKPELLQALPAGVRSQYAERWTALESSLGRPSFHALFDHFVVIEQAATTAVGSNSNGSKPGVNSSSSSSNGSKQDGSNGNGAVHKGFVPPGSSLMSHGSSADSSQHEPAHSNGGKATAAAAAAAAAAVSSSSNSSALPALARPDVLQHFSNHPDVEAALDQVLQYGQRLLLLRANDWSALAAEGGSGPSIAAELEEACFFVNLLSDDTWQPWVLEFFYQSEDDAKRAAFLRGAEVLQLYCELKQDEAFKHQRWLAVGQQLLRRPFYSDQVLATLALSADEAEDFIKLLDSRELAASADERLLVHLLLRADSINRKTTDWRKLKVEKIMPSNPPDRSRWRKQKLLLPALTDEEYATAASSSSTSYGLFSPSSRNRSSSAGGGSGLSSSRSSKGSRSRTTSSSNSGRRTSERSPTDADGSTSSIDSSSGNIGSSSSSSVPAGMREVRYWHEITRSHWHNRLGNLLLLQPTGRESPGTSHLSADLPTKLRYYEACASDEHFPDFTGGLVNGRYSRDMFSPEECRQRHADIISRLIAVFELQGSSNGF